MAGRMLNAYRNHDQTNQAVRYSERTHSDLLKAQRAAFTKKGCSKKQAALISDWVSECWGSAGFEALQIVRF